MSQDTNVENLIINKLTKAQYESIATPDPTQLYFVTDEVISSSDVTTALGYTPYNASNPAGYISGITSSDVITALGYTPYNATNPEGYISGITSSDVTTALGYTPYNASNPAGYTSNIGTVTSVNNIQPDTNGNVTITIPDTATWGNITGTLSNQTDLQTALNNKLNSSDIELYTATEIETLWGSV